MLVRVWAYQVAPEAAAEFEREYGADGSWALLFASVDGHLGTELFRGLGSPGRYVTVDRFVNEESWRGFLTARQAEYEQLGARLAGLTTSQEELA